MEVTTGMSSHDVVENYSTGFEIQEPLPEPLISTLEIGVCVHLLEMHVRKVEDKGLNSPKVYKKITESYVWIRNMNSNDWHIEKADCWSHVTEAHLCEWLYSTVHNWVRRFIDWLGFNGTFSTNMPYCALENYVAVKKVKLMTKLTMLRVGNKYNKPLQWITLQSGICRGNLSTQQESIIFPANHLANILTNKTKRHRKIHDSIQLNKPKKLNTINTS